MFARNMSWLLLLLSFHTFAINYDQLKGPIAQLKQLAQKPQIIQAVKAHDKPLNIREMLKIDQQWHTNEKLAAQLLDADTQIAFQQLISRPHGVFVELILMGSNGQTLAAIPKTSDYWQGDEDKFTQIMEHDDVFVGALNWDESSQTVSAQISVPVIEDGKIIGVLTGAVEASLKALSTTEIDP